MLNRLTLLVCVACFCAAPAIGQLRYTFKDTTATYSPLTSATSLNGSTIWDEEDFTAPVPFTWKLDSLTSMTTLPVSLSVPGFVSNPGSLSNVNGFVLGDFNLADRGNASMAASLSPIRYVTTGSAPNRIFKLELANAGFYDEVGSHGTMSDYINVQIWIYETSNIVELRFGPSQISYPGDYYFFSGGPMMGFAQHADFQNGSSGRFYYVKGATPRAVLDSLVMSTTTPMPTNMIANWPANGTVYRFIPKSYVTCTFPNASFSSAAPVGMTVSYTYSGTTTAIDSLVWDFGDGKKQKVTSGFTLPVSHTFAAKGRFNVTVTAYNSCGSTTSTAKQVALSVGGLDDLAGVSVYPNPASGVLTIEGLTAGATATVISAVGQEVLSVEVSSNKQQLSIAALPVGSYVLFLSDRAGAHTALHFVKQ